MNICQLHGHPDDLVLCPRSTGQNGRVAMWWGYGAPAGVEKCGVCNGRGRMPRHEADKLRSPRGPYEGPPCICQYVREERLAVGLRDGERVFADGNQWCAVGPDFVNLQESHAGFGDSPRQAVDELRFTAAALNAAPAGEKQS